MHSMLVILNPHDPGSVQAGVTRASLDTFVDGKLKPFPNAERLSAGVWLVNMCTDPAPFALLVAAAHEHGIGYRILALDDAPQWLPAP